MENKIQLIELNEKTNISTYLVDGVYEVKGKYNPNIDLPFNENEEFVGGILTVLNISKDSNNLNVVQYFKSAGTETINIFTRRLTGNINNIITEEWKNIESSISSSEIIWDSNSNMDNFIEPGIYNIYGERTRQDDNLPIMNVGSGHSIAAKLTVIASTLQPNNDEICVTQFLQLSNRIGGEGTTYIRTYNENNNGIDGWSLWQKQMGIVETYINSDIISIDFQGNYRIGHDRYSGLNNFIDNGMYSGVYTSNSYFTEGTSDFLETFVLIVINDYVISNKLNLPRHITQLKYAIDAMTGQSTVKKRVGTGSDTISWNDWEDIGSGSGEVDVTNEVYQNGLPNFVSNKFIQEGVTYVIHFLNIDLHQKNINLDTKGKLADFFKNKYIDSPCGGCIKFNYKVLKGHPDYEQNVPIIDGVFYSDGYKYSFYIIYNKTYIDEKLIYISQDMIGV